MSKKHGRNIWVIRTGAKYSIKGEGIARPLVDPVSQRKAIKIARLLAQANKSELFIQNKRGRIRAKDSHGFDSFPPKG
jgi:hypothetical protein